MLVNFIWFQLIWFLAVLFQDKFWWLLALLIILHFALRKNTRLELLTIVPVALTGMIIDTSLTLSGLFVFPPSSMNLIIPIWLMALWLGFAGTLRHSMHYLQNRPWLSAALGLVSAPLSYFAGYRFEAVAFPLGLTTSLVCIGLVWAVFLPMAFRFIKFVEAQFTRIAIAEPCRE